MENFKTPIENLFFRASRIGALVSGVIRYGLTDIQLAEMQRLESLKTTPEGLTEKQQEDYNKLHTMLSEGITLSPAQVKKYEDLRFKKITPKGLTDKQAELLQYYKERLAKKPELSEGARNYVKEVWLENERGYREMFTSKELQKGIEAENDALTLISDVDNVPYFKNRETRYKGHISGTCDSVFLFHEVDLKVVDDTKCSYSPMTFMKAELSTAYEWQGRAYMHLWDADVFRLRYCLVDTPPGVLADEYKRFCYAHNILDDSLPEYKELIEQFERNHIYSKNPMYSDDERVKTFSINRDFSLESKMLEAVDLAVEYYKTITLNMIEQDL